VQQRLRAPRNLNGPYYVFVVTDPPRSVGDRGDVFELDRETNNATSSAQPLLILQPPPADLIVTAIQGPTTSLVGESVHLEWTVANRDAPTVSPASGSWTDAIYLSADAVWDVNDRLIGRVEHGGTLDRGESYTSMLDTVLPTVKPGSYRLIVRTDLYDEVFEGPDEGNNRTTGADPLNVTARELRLGVPEATTLSSGQERLFQVTVGANQTLRIKLTTTAADASNEMFIRFGDVPSNFAYDAIYGAALQPNQTVIVGGTQPGTYYVLVRGQSEPAADTPVTLLAEVLPFQVLDIVQDRGGDSRYVTVTVLGAQFDRDAVVKLIRPGIAEYSPARYQVMDSTRIVAVFDLREAPHGLYDVAVINPDGARATVPYRFLVEEAIEPDVVVGLGGTRVLFAGESGLYGFTVASTTNVDMPYVHLDYGIPQMGYVEEFTVLKSAIYQSPRPTCAVSRTWPMSPGPVWCRR
jgi:hypothetical protein